MAVTVTLFKSAVMPDPIHNFCRHEEGDGFFINSPTTAAAVKLIEDGKAIFRMHGVCIARGIGQSRRGSEE